MFKGIVNRAAGRTTAALAAVVLAASLVPTLVPSPAVAAPVAVTAIKPSITALSEISVDLDRQGKIIRGSTYTPSQRQNAFILGSALLVEAQRYMTGESYRQMYVTIQEFEQCKGTGNWPRCGGILISTSDKLDVLIGRMLRGEAVGEYWA